jgi:Carboxypeptidase regulatory-like domain
VNHRLGALLAAMTIAAAACGGTVQSLSFPAAPTTVTTPPAPPTLPTNLSAFGEVPVPGVTTTTVPAVSPGQATLNGTVFGPNGPVPGATVWADRFVGDQVASTHATTAADGSWTIAGIKGGRYRIRAWQSPSLDLITPQVVFLSATQTLTMSLQLASFTGPTVSDSVSPAAPVVDQPTSLLVQVTNPTVGPDGIVRNPPVTGVQVNLVNGPDWQINNGNGHQTDANGEALFVITCLNPGAAPLSAAVGSASAVPLQMPGCGAPPTPVTVPPPCPTTTIGAGTLPPQTVTTFTTFC